MFMLKKEDCMKKYWISICILLFVLAAFQATAHQGTDHEKLVEAMHKNQELMGQLGNAVKAGEYFIAAETLMEIAKIMKSLETITPEKGSKEDWDNLHQDLIEAAFKGIGACADEDSETLKAYIREISGLIKEGHGIFR
jgi:hypothetical protein